MTAWLRDPLFIASLILAVPIWALAHWRHVGVMPASGGVDAACSILLMQPFFEEMFFRGAMQGALKTRIPAIHLYHLSGANVLVSGVFATAHLWRHPVWLAAAVLAPSLVYGHLRDRWSSIWPGVLLHVYHNTGLLLVGFLN